MLLLDTNNDTIQIDRMDQLIQKMRQNPVGIRFAELSKVCDFYFGPPRQNGSSHKIYKMPWPGNPRINIQSSRGEAKAYQVKQFLLALDKLLEKNNA